VNRFTTHAQQFRQHCFRHLRFIQTKKRARSLETLGARFGHLSLIPTRMNIITLAHLKVNITNMKHCSNNTHHFTLLSVGKANLIKTRHRLRKRIRIPSTLQRGTITEVTECSNAIVQFELCQRGIIGTGKYLIKDVIIPLTLNLRRNARLFQKVVGYGRSYDGAGFGVEGNFDEFTKAGRVVIFESSGIAKTFEEGI